MIRMFIKTYVSDALDNRYWRVERDSQIVSVRTLGQVKFGWDKKFF